MLTGKLPGIHGAYFAPDEGAGGGGSETGEQDWMADIELNLGEDFGQQKGSTSFGTGDEDPNPDDAKNKDDEGNDDDAAKKLADEEEAKKKVEAEELAQKQAKEKEEADKKKAADDKEQETSTIRQMRKTIRALQKEVRGLKEPAEKDKSKEPEFTEEELLKIMEEHDDGSVEGKRVLLNVMKYMRDQGIKSAEKASVAVAKREKIAQTADTFFSGVYHDYGDEDFDERLDTEFPEDEWELNGHPHSKRLRAALTIIAQLPKLRETWVEEAVGKAKVEFETAKANRQTEEVARRVEEAKKKEDIEKARKAEIAKRGLPKSSSGGEKAQPSEKVSRIAKELQLSPSAAKIYAGFVGEK